MHLRIAGVTEEVFALRWAKAVQELADPVPKAFDGSLFVLSQVSLELGEGLFDRVQVRGIGWQIAQFGAGGLDREANVLAFVSAEIVHDDDVALFEGRNKDLADISLEPLASHRAVEHHGRGQAAGSEPGCECGDFPMAMRSRPLKAPAAEGPASQPDHVGGATRFVDKDQPFGIKAGLAFAPVPAGRSDVRALLFAGQDGFF